MKGRTKKDITVRYIPNLLADEGRTLQSFPYDRRWTIRRYLKKSGICFKGKQDDIEGMRIIVNGNEIKNLRKRLQSGDEIAIFPAIEFQGIAVWWAAATFWQGVALVVGTVGTILTIAYSIYSALTTKVKSASYDTSGDGTDEDSPSASWTGVKTSRDPNGSIPIIYGRRLTGGTVINEFITTDGEKNYLNSLVALCEGPIKSITLSRINQNNAENFSNYTLENRLGTNDQAIIPNFEDLHDINSLSIKLEEDSPYTYTSKISDLEAFEVILQLPNGIYQQGSSGNISSWSVTYRVEYKLHSSGTWIDLGTTTINAKTSSTIQRIFRKAGLTAGQYDIRVTRTSNDPSDLSYPITVGTLYLTGIDEINTDDLAYPNTVVSGIKALAVEELSGDEPNYEFLVEGKLVLVPKVMNGAEEVDWEDYYWDPVAEKYKLLSDDTELTWDEETYVERFSANPIWCKYDLMTNTRYGLGDHITTSDHDLDYLLEMSRYCEERVPDGEGGYEKRFRLDICIDSQQGALELIMQLAGVFRGMPFYSDQGKIRIAIDKPDSPVQLFGMGNIVKDSFSQSWGSKRDIPNIVHVQFDNEDNYYEQDMIQVLDEESLAAEKPKNPRQVRYYGTKLSYAIRYGRFIIKAAKYINRTISIKAGTGAFVRQCGEVIDIAHDVPLWGFSGCVKPDFNFKDEYDAETSYVLNDACSYEGNDYKCIQASTGNLPTDTDYWEVILKTKVKLDRTVEIEAGNSYAIRVDFANGNYEERIVTDLPGSYTEVTVDTAFTTTPKRFDAYSFGILDKLVMPARIVSLKRQRNGEIEIEAQEYNEDIYDDSAVTIPTRKLSSLSLGIPNVTGLKLTERLVKQPDGAVETAIDVWFDKPTLSNYSVGAYKKAVIYLSDNNGDSWIYAGETSGRHFAIIGNLKDLQNYKVAVVSVSSFDSEKSIDNSPQDTITLFGDTVLPGDVPAFLVNQSRDRLTMGWTGVSDVRVLDYELRYGESWDTGQIIATKRDTTHIELNFRIGESQKFFIKAKTRSGRYSLTATEAIITIDNIPFTNLIESYSEQTGWAGTKTNTTKVGNNLEISEGELSGTYITPVRDIGYVATFKIGIETVIVDASTTEKMNDSLTDKMNDSLTERMSGDEVIGAATFRIKTSEDNSTWSDWRAYQVGDYNCRYFQLEMTLTRSNTSKVLQCSQLNYYSDLPDVDEVINDEVTDAGTGKAVVFTKTFHNAPGVNIDILSGDGYLHKFSSVPDLTGFTVKLYDLSGVAKTGLIRAAVHGI